MAFLGGVFGVLETLFWFLLVLTPVVFIHEFGHYWVARRAGVRVEVFSVGFGRELFGFTDRAGTRWRFALIPFGGYVKMFGQNDLGPDGQPDGGAATSAEDRAVSFHHKPPGWKMAIVAAGPAANFIFAIVGYALVFMTVGQFFTPARISTVMEGSAAAAAGLQPGDVFVSVAGKEIQRFEEVQMQISLRPGIPTAVTVRRGDQILSQTITPGVRVTTDSRGNPLEIGLLGVTRDSGRERVRHSPPQAVWQAMRETVQTISMTFTAIGQMLTGDRSARQLGGPVQIAQMSDRAASGGMLSILLLACLISVNLGLVNLLPIPVLDGGHLVFHTCEFVARQPLGAGVQAFATKIGLVLVLGLMVFATFNDILRL